MKKLLLTLLLLFSVGMVAKAEVATFDATKQGYSNAATVTNVKVDDITITFGKGSNSTNAPKYYTKGTAIRMYAGNTVKIEGATDVTISNIVFTTTSPLTSGFEANVGTVSTSSNSWSGSTNIVTFTNNTSGQVRISKMVITYTAAKDERSEVVLSFNPSENAIDLGETFTAPTLSATVNGTENAAAKAAVVYTSSNEDLLNVDANGTFTLTPNVAGKATVTASIPEGNELFKATEAATFKLTVVDPDAVDPIYEWKLVTDAAQLEAGDLLIIASESVAAGNKESSNSRPEIGVTVENNILTYSETETDKPLILELEGTKDKWKFKTTNYQGTNGYLKNANNGSDKNYLLVATNGYTASIAFTDNNAIITFNDPAGSQTRNKVQYNSSSKIFACYNNTQASVQLYKYTEKPKEVYQPGLTALGLTVNDTRTITLPAIGEIPAPTKVTITSDNTEAVTVEGNEIKAVAAGKANITVEWKATASWLKGNASFEVTVTRKAAGLRFEKDAYTAFMGDEFTAPELKNDNNLNVSYSSSNDKVATVDATGNVTLVGAGEATITANSEQTDVYEAGEAMYTLTISRKAAGLSYKQEDHKAYIGEEFTAPELVNPNGLAVTYTSEDEAVATVDADGKVTIKAAGITIITANSEQTDVYEAGEAMYMLEVEEVDVLAGAPVLYVAHGIVGGVIVVDYSFTLKNWSGVLPMITIQALVNNAPIQLTELTAGGNTPAAAPARIAAESQTFSAEAKKYKSEALKGAENVVVKLTASIGTKELFSTTQAPQNTTGIEDVVVDGNDDAEYYTLQGLRVSEPQAGQLYIKRQAGKAVKVRF